MADKRDVFDDDLLSQKNEPRLSHALEHGPDPSSIGDAPIGKAAAKRKSQVPWFKNPEVIKVVVAGAVVLVVVLIVLIWQFGLFSGSGQSKPPLAVAQPSAQPTPESTQQTPEAAQPTPEAMQPTPEAAQPTQPTPPPGQSPESTAEKPAEPQKPPLPEKVSEWKAEHFFRARRENDPKLLEAVAYVGKKYAGSEPTAKALTKLLMPLPPEKPPEKPAEPAAPGQTPPAAPNGPPSLPPEGLPANPEVPPMPGATPGAPPATPGAMAGLVEAIIIALGNNGSEPARNTIEGVLAGTFKTDDDKAAVEAALKALLAHPGPENDALLLRVLTEPGVLRPLDRQGPWREADLQAKAFEMTKQSASSGLRTELAKALAARRVMLNPKDPMHEFLLAANPLNCGAQLTLYEKGQPTEEMKTTLENQFLEYSSLAMARYLGIPDNLDQPASSVAAPAVQPDQPGGLIGGFEKPNDDLTGPRNDPNKPAGAAGKTGPGEAKPSEENPAPRIAAGLWSQRFLILLEPKLTTHAVDSLEKKSKLVMLAGTIPQDSTRALLNKLLRKRWDEGPTALETAGLADKTVADPGMLTLIKMLDRKDYKSAKGAAAAARPAGGTVNKRIEEEQKKREKRQEWMDLSAKLVPLWCKRFHAAAQARQKTESASEGETTAPLKLPPGFELGPNARVAAWYHLSWPDEAPPEIGALNPGLLEVYYVRIEETNVPRKATAFYSRKVDLRSSDARTIDRSTWLDNVRVGAKKDRRQSLDVLITPPENYVPAEKIKDEDETDLIVEILSVEIKDPLK